MSAAFAVAETAPLLDEARDWTSASGKKTAAFLINVTGDSVILRKEGGEDFAVPIAGLSAADRKFVGYVQEFLRTQVQAARPEKAVYIVKSDVGSGTGFLAREDLTVYFYSNYHVIAGAKELKISAVDGDELDLPTQVEVSVNRDLIRFPIAGKDGLKMAAGCTVKEPIHTFGDAGGVGVIRRLDGAIIAKGPEKLEISAKIIPGNSGGPVLNRKGEVVGVVTYMLRHSDLPDWIREGTPFSGTRRMAVRVHGAKWVRMPVADFARHTQYLRTVRMDMVRAIIAAHTAVVHPYEVALEEGFSYELMNGWAKKYNMGVAKIKGMLGKKIATRHVETRDRQLREDYARLGSDFQKRLAQYGVLLAGKAKMMPETCIRRELKQYAEFCEEFGEAAAKQMTIVSEGVFITQ